MRLIFSTFLIGTVFLNAFGASAYAMEDTPSKQQEVANVAHRGASAHAPENTMAAFEKAVDMKAGYIEIDVQMTEDEELVVIHDITVNRTTDGRGFVGDLSLEEIQALDAGSWFGKEFANEQIPTFEEVIDAYRGKIGILIELKSPELYPGIEEKVADVLIERNMQHPQNEKIIIQSFNHESMQVSKELLPNVPHGVLAGMTWDGVTEEQLANFATYADYFNPNLNIVTDELVTSVHEEGMEIYPYTVRAQKEADKLINLGVDGIITDYPEYVYKHPVNN
ncbi:glycerophosphodiester phosphodiesterase [Virgibacillus sp. L01]|uniref:glycerophosphodiester phosphodiesterase n=1 Tax=Virgibacillus sp. L01 TaxID=3457429 RepID=UPI003FD140F0